MNINNATQSNVSHIQNKTQLATEKNNNAVPPAKTNVIANEDKVSLSPQGKVSGHLQSLPAKEQAEVTAFMQNLGKQTKTAGLQQQLNNAPQSVKNMAEKLNMELKDIAAAMPEEAPAKPTKTSSKGVSAYNAIASQSGSVSPSSLLNTAVNKSTTANAAIG